MNSIASLSLPSSNVGLSASYPASVISVPYSGKMVTSSDGTSSLDARSIVVDVIRKSNLETPANRQPSYEELVRMLEEATKNPPGRTAWEEIVWFVIEVLGTCILVGGVQWCCSGCDVSAIEAACAGAGTRLRILLYAPLQEPELPQGSVPPKSTLEPPVPIRVNLDTWTMIRRYLESMSPVEGESNQPRMFMGSMAGNSVTAVCYQTQRPDGTWRRRDFTVQTRGPLIPPVTLPSDLEDDGTEADSGIDSGRLQAGPPGWDWSTRSSVWKTGTYANIPMAHQHPILSLSPKITIAYYSVIE
ncbi:hypothetical protein FFLO_05215 [Filobasidium floriforme]|uniref:Uncharacterized protein n=1 Tax=Filobasidium floriforme TaxID=5210 RepID=A0A8K0JHD5_9TREE|nr:uncharacterized protein HD553DRAFT_322761 [Filobasidium floriforme]KAG7530167.1 hypothetical protein FFLO_05215 [Filobasidium floriforme]KAH8087252.1 hypothetical protein HD553DRAFT_322761 [Filobasidium floriforme]